MLAELTAAPGHEHDSIVAKSRDFVCLGTQSCVASSLALDRDGFGIACVPGDILIMSAIGVFNENRKSYNIAARRHAIIHDS